MSANLLGGIIGKRRRELGLTLQNIGDAMGVSKGTVKKWESGVIGSMKSERLPVLARVLELSVNDLIGVGGRKESGLAAVPVVGRVAAGLGCYAEESTEGYEYVCESELNSAENYIFLRVSGDSMAPVILDGDLVLIRCQSSVDSGTYAVVIIDGCDGVVKKVCYGDDWIELVSENPYYSPRRFEGSEVMRVRVVGKVMESRRKF